MDDSPDTLHILLQGIMAGQEASMSQLYDATVRRVYGLAVKIVHRPELAEEIVGDVYLQVWQQADKYNPQRASPIAWILMICRSRALDKLRREKSATMNQYQEDPQQDTLDETTPTALDSMMQNELSTRITNALRLLSKSQRQTIALAFYRGMSHQQIAHYTGEPLGTVKSNIRRAQAVLRNALDSDDINVGGLYG